jgi:glycosyltransferase involved in cell wall biosynthesis
MVKNAINAFQFRFSPTVRQAVHRSAAIFAQTSADQYNLLRTYNKNAILLHEQAADLSHGTPHRFNGQRFLNIAWIGRCIAGKAMELLLRAAAQTRNPKMLNLHLIGDGPELPRWKALAQKLGIAPHCSWYGWLDQSRTNDILNSCDLLAFTSLLEGTPATVIKSLSLGVPVMCLNHCGPADVVTNTCGSLIPVGRPQDMESHMAIQLDEILVCPERIEQWSRNALRQAEKYTWEAAAEQIRQVYLDCLEMAPSAETICVG